MRLIPHESIPEIPFPDYCWTDTAFGSVSNRNKIQRVDLIQLPKVPRECYRGMFRFRHELARLVSDTGSVSGSHRFSCYADCLWFDIDDAELDRAREKALELLTRLETKYGMALDLVQISHSGSKGFHIGIPSPLCDAQPSADLPVIFKRMAIELAGDILIDTAIYEKNRLWRMPNSINGKSGLYKIPITHDELSRLDSAGLRELAKMSRDIPQVTSIPIDPNEKLVSLYRVSVQGQHRSKDISRPKVSLKGDKPCITRLLAGVGEGQRNEACIRLADHFRKDGNDATTALARLMEWNARNQPPMPEVEIKASVDSAYSGDYDYGCNDPVLKSLCEGICPLKKKGKDDKPVSVSFVELSDGTLLEMVFDPASGAGTQFARCKAGQIAYVDECHDPLSGVIYQPMPAGKLIRTKTIHLPSRVDGYGSESDLLRIVDQFISKYLVVSPFFHTLSVYYVLLTWVYDNFTILPYLRVRGDYGTGKSRFLQTVGALCYKPIFCMGAATVSPIFRLIDAYHGTLIIDESDFSDSDDSNRIVKILNSGFQQGFPVLLTETIASNKLEPQSFDVFGPKLIASRREFKDRALESRCITEFMDKAIHPRVPINLPRSFWDEAREIRNQLLSWRFAKWGKIDINETGLNIPVEPRLAQIMTPLMAIIQDQTVRDDFIGFMQRHNKQIIEERGESLDGKVARAVCELWDDKGTPEIRIKNIRDKVSEYLDDPEFKLTPHTVGKILRATLNFKPVKQSRGYVIERSTANAERLEKIARKFGVERASSGESSQSSPSSSPVAGQQVSR